MPDANNQDVLNAASKILKERHNITHTTIQVEDYHDLTVGVGDDCQDSTSGKYFCCPLFLCKQF